MKKLELKICGMKDNTEAVSTLEPAYLGFIFYEGSPRNYTGVQIPPLSLGIKKVGVFVDASIEYIVQKIEKYNLQVIQLHGEESVDFCNTLKKRCLVERQPERFILAGSRDLKKIKIWKVFSIKDSFDFSVLKEYEPTVDAFLFDTKGASKGGNGVTFNWEVLKGYPSKIPFILSGGIGLEELSEIKELLIHNLPIMAIDVNSKFEDAPGLKNIQKLKEFKDQLTTI